MEISIQIRYKLDKFAKINNEKRETEIGYWY